MFPIPSHLIRPFIAFCVTSVIFDQLGNMRPSTTSSLYCTSGPNKVFLCLIGKLIAYVLRKDPMGKKTFERPFRCLGMTIGMSAHFAALALTHPTSIGNMNANKWNMGAFPSKTNQNFYSIYIPFLQTDKIWEYLRYLVQVWFWNIQTALKI